MLPHIAHPLGVDRDYDFSVLDAAGDPEDVTGWTFSFAVWDALTETPAKAFELTSANGGVIVDAVDQGIGRIRVLASHVEGKAPGHYNFVFECSKNGGAKDRLDEGIFLLLPTKPAS